MATGDLATLEDVKAILQIEGGDVNADGALQGFISAWSTSILNCLGLDSDGFTAKDVVQYYNGTGSPILMLRRRPVNSVSAVAINGYSISPATTTLSGFTFDERAVYWQNGIFSYGIRNIEVSYNGGYLTVPADISHACARLAAQTYRRVGHIDKESESAGGMVTVSYARYDVPADVKRMLSEYANVVAL